MDGDKTDTVYLVALDGFATEVFFPLAKKGVDVGAVFADVTGEVVVEGTDIGTLFLKTLQLEDGVEFLDEFVERQGGEFVGVSDESFWQQALANSS